MKFKEFLSESTWFTDADIKWLEKHAILMNGDDDELFSPDSKVHYTWRELLEYREAQPALSDDWSLHLRFRSEERITKPSFDLSKIIDRIDETDGTLTNVYYTFGHLASWSDIWIDEDDVTYLHFYKTAIESLSIPSHVLPADVHILCHECTVKNQNVLGLIKAKSNLSTIEFYNNSMNNLSDAQDELNNAAKLTLELAKEGRDIADIIEELHDKGLEEFAKL